MAEYMWFLTVAGGPLILGIIIAFALLRRRRLSRREQQKQNQATRELYRGD